ncbi:MAG: arylsulfatase [Akkermansiaceae bacterium]
MTLRKTLVAISLIASLLTIATAAPRPNIVLVMADDMGFSDIGCYGGEIRTPVLDSLAAKGLRFTGFYNAARCCPTRASLLTGLYPHQAGVGHMVDDHGKAGYRGRLSKHSVTLAEVLRSSGYQTFMSGKWHVTPYHYSNPEPTLHRESWPLQRGFDRFFGTLAGGGSFYTPVSLMRDNEFIEVPGNDFYYTDAISDEAATYIRTAVPERPFFLYVAYTAPHWPLHARESDIASYKDTYQSGWDQMRENRYRKMSELGMIDPKTTLLSQRPENIPAWKDAEHQEWESRRMAVHAAMLTVMDEGIGRIVDALRETKALDNTLIVFLSDNGACAEVAKGTRTRHGKFARGGTRPDVMPGPPDTYAGFGREWAHASNTPLRRYKSSCYEGGIATPLVVHWPRGIEAGGGLRHCSSHIIDLMPTFAELAGAKYPAEREGQAVKPAEGVSLLPVFDSKPLPARPLFFEHEGNRAVIQDGWKLVALHKQPWELYHLAEDRTETKNLAAEQPERTRAMSATYEAWAERAQVLPWPLR